MSPFSSLAEYERLVYTLQQQFPSVTRSTLVVVRRGRLFAELSGELTLASEPRHKHIPPNIKHHRIPAPDLSFAAPNLPFLIREIESNPPDCTAPQNADWQEGTDQPA